MYTIIKFVSLKAYVVMYSEHIAFNKYYKYKTHALSGHALG